MEDNVVIPPKTGVITFNMVILIAADDPHYSPDLIRRTFHVTTVAYTMHTLFLNQIQFVSSDLSSYCNREKHL